MGGFSYWKGVAVASAAAGPLFLLATFATSLPLGPMTTPDGWALAAFAAVASVPIGFALAILPNLVGAVMLGALGRDNDAVRLPVFWALVGAGLGALVDAGIVAGGGTPGFVPLFTLTSLASALLCRWGTRWTD